MALFLFVRGGTLFSPNFFEDYNLILFPIHDPQGFHYLTITVDVENKTVKSYNSLDQKNVDKKFLKVILKWLNDEHRLLYDGVDLNLSEWKSTREKCPLQSNGVDCGVFCMTFLRHLALGRNVLEHVSSANMAHHRLSIAVELIEGCLRGV